MKQLGKTAAFWTAVLLVWEAGFHYMVYGGLSLRFLSALPFSLGIAGILTVLSHLWSAPLANKITRFVLLTLLLAVFGVQTVYYQVFGTLLSLAYVELGADAVSNFWPLVIDGILTGLPMLLLCLLPYLALAVLHRRGILDCRQAGPAQGVVLAGCAVLVYALGVPPAGYEGRAAVYYDAQTTVDRQTEYFGLLTAERLELGRLTSDDTGLSAAGPDLQGSGSQGERNIMPEIDFEVLSAATDDESIQALNSYFAKLSGTAKNAYTGLFSGYNYIQICAEGFSPYLIDPELTPALYRLTHEGIVFENFYNSFPAVTSNGEYSMCMGLMPDLSRLSFATSMDNYVPFTLAHFFTEQEGRHPLAYHNNYATFYNRINTHTNMGYDFRAIDYGLDMEPDRPASDLEMMEKSVDDFIGEEPFAVHYMTYSGHTPYNFSVNAMSVKNEARARALGLDCSEELLAYYACQLELEDAVAYLLQRLEEAGIADHTVVVLSGDHYPYGLADETYEELAGDAVEGDPFWRYRNCFACWTGALEEPVHIDDYCCTQDIMPTVCNLFGLTYESRMLTGTDVLSDSTHVALLQDGSFLTKGLTYDSNTGRITYRVPEEELPEGYAQQLIQATKNQFSVAAAILRTDYFGFVFSTLDLTDDTAPVVTDRASFSDINGTWYRNSVEYLIGRGSLSGTRDGMFVGEETCTRIMFLTMLTRTLYLSPNEDGVLPFVDIPRDMWCYRYVLPGWSAGLVPTGRYFRPDDPLTEEDADIEDAGRWAGNVVSDVLALARSNGESTETISRGAAAAIVARLVVVTE